MSAEAQASSAVSDLLAAAVVPGVAVTAPSASTLARRHKSRAER